MVSTVITSPNYTTNELTPDGDYSGSQQGSTSGQSSIHHRMQLLEERFCEQESQTQVAMAQVTFLTQQLAAEQEARVEAQERIQELLLHNKQLLQHITQLVGQMQELERRFGVSGDGGSNRTFMSPQLTSSHIPDICSQGSGQILYAQLQAVEAPGEEGTDGDTSSSGSSGSPSPPMAGDSDREMKHKTRGGGGGGEQDRDSGHDSNPPPPATPELLPPYSRVDPNKNTTIANHQQQQKNEQLDPNRNVTGPNHPQGKTAAGLLRLDPPPKNMRQKRGLSRTPEEKEVDLLDLTSDEDATSGGAVTSLPGDTPSPQSSTQSMENMELPHVHTSTVIKTNGN